MLTLLQVFFFFSLFLLQCFKSCSGKRLRRERLRAASHRAFRPSTAGEGHGDQGGRGQWEEIGQDVFRAMPRALCCQVSRGQGRSQRPSMCCLAEGRVQAKQGVKCLLIRSVKTGLERQARLRRAWKCDKRGLMQRDMKFWGSGPHCR